MGGLVQPEEFDYFHEMIISQEICRTGARSFNDGNLGGMVIGLPAVLYHCHEEKVRTRVTNEVLSGRKRICLAISEAFAGSDVAGMRTTAVKSSDGTHYVVNGRSSSLKRSMLTPQVQRSGSRTGTSLTTLSLASRLPQASRCS